MLFARRVLDTALGANWVLVFQQAEGAFGEDLLREVFGDFGGTRLSLRSPLRAPLRYASKSLCVTANWVNSGVVAMARSRSRASRMDRTCSSSGRRSR